ncbi:MAG: hemolysin family protein [Oligoflexales bacterium]
MEIHVAPDDITSILIILGCLAGSAFFSAAETAITSLGVLKAKHLLEQQTENAIPSGSLELWVKKPSRVLTTILAINNLMIVLAAAVATQMAMRHFESQAVAIATGVVTFLILIFGEILPKSYARGHSDTLYQIALPIMNFLYRILILVIWPLSVFTSYVLRKLGSTESMQPYLTEEELEFLIQEGQKTGVLEESQKQMISGVFEFDDTKVREIMTPRTDIVAIEKRQDLDSCLKLIIQSGHSRIPVYEERIDNIVGIILAKDLMRQMAQAPAKKPVLSELMREPFFVPESKPIMEVFKELNRSKNHLAVIIDEYGGTAGIVTMEDILEEIVGDIQDEFDSEEAKIVKIKKGTYDVSGSMNISEFADFFGLDGSFEEDVEGDVDTIGGWMTRHLGNLPEIGQTLIHEPLTLEVAAVDRHRIERLRVIKHQPQVAAVDAEATT